MDARLAELGLTPEELASDPILTRALESWQRTPSPEREARLLEALAGYAPPVSLLEARLKRLGHRLRASSLRLPMDELESAEAEYFELREAVEAGPSRDERSAMWRRLLAIERRIGAT